MSDPYYPAHQTYTAPQDNAFQPPLENQDQYQGSLYGYEPQQTHNPQLEGYQNAYSQQQYTPSALGQEYTPIQTTYHPVSEPQNGYLTPAPTMAGADAYTHGYDNTRLSPHYESRPRGSNAEYYDPNLQEDTQYSAANEVSSSAKREDDEVDAGGGERGIGGALVGGVTGYYLGHKKSHGLLGAVGGALLGNFLENKIGERNEDGDSHSGHGRHHGHGRRRTRHHRRHRRHSRSESRHSRRSSSSSSR
ncbi:uncharacterized protein BDW70DRAFT_125806 [Aspergillus foveolatus]|uniref:uncharacterized protein n=1 Tax=Aspergillus foveolatus TaxID=210207 RepID=UPI003CCCF5C2